MVVSKARAKEKERVKANGSMVAAIVSITMINGNSNQHTNNQTNSKTNYPRIRQLNSYHPILITHRAIQQTRARAGAQAVSASIPASPAARSNNPCTLKGITTCNKG